MLIDAELSIDCKASCEPSIVKLIFQFLYRTADGVAPELARVGAEPGGELGGTPIGRAFDEGEPRDQRRAVGGQRVDLVVGAFDPTAVSLGTIEKVGANGTGPQSWFICSEANPTFTRSIQAIT